MIRRILDFVLNMEAARWRATLPNLIIYQSEFGAGADGVGWIMGEVAYYEDVDDSRTYWVSDYEQHWSRQADGHWRMTNWIVGPFREVRFDDE